MSKQLTQSGAAYHKLKTNREKNLTKYTGSINDDATKAEKNRKSKMKAGEQEEKARPLIENEKCHFPFQIL